MPAGLEVTGIVLEVFPSIATVWVLFDRKADIQLRDFPVMS